MSTPKKTYFQMILSVESMFPFEKDEVIVEIQRIRGFKVEEISEDRVELGKPYTYEDLRNLGETHEEALAGSDEDSKRMGMSRIEKILDDEMDLN